MDDLECLEMAKALYQFKGTITKTLTFRESDYFIIYQQSTKERNWWQVISRDAEVGYVPSNYVISVKVDGAFIIRFIDDCIDVLRKESDDAKGCLPSDRQELLLKLLERKTRVERALENLPLVSDCSSACTSASRISPPLLLRPSKKVVVTHSSPSILHNSKDEKEEKKKEDKKKDEKKKEKKEKKTDVTSWKSSSSITQTSEQTSVSQTSSKSSVERSYSRDEVSDICGQIGTPLSETRKSVSSIVQNLESTARSESLTRKTSSLDGEVITEEMVYQLVEKVRCNTELSHELSRVAVDVVVSELKKYIPNCTVLEKILLIVQGPISAPKPLIEHTHDAKRLHVIFSELTSCKDDAQQRSWMLHEDEAVIIDYVKELTSILTNADGNICRHVISNDQYAGVLALTQYYQMEVRWSIRQPLLQALGVLCGLDRAIISIFLSSILPMELARDMKADSRNIPKLNYSALLLTMIFSMGEPMPITHLEHLGVDFVTFLLDHIEDPPDTDTEDQIPDLFVTLILSYNLQFKNMTDNVVLKAILEKSVAKTFTEKILLLLNREDDPVRIFDHEPAPSHSVLKLFIDLFSHKHTANLFYTNDVKVLVDILVRQLADLSPGDQEIVDLTSKVLVKQPYHSESLTSLCNIPDTRTINDRFKRRHQYLQLCRVVMRNSSYSEHHHRKDEISKSFTRIFCEDTEISIKDQQLVREISNEFPQYFNDHKSLPLPLSAAKDHFQPSNQKLID